jgi:hypothetical protein
MFDQREGLVLSDDENWRDTGIDEIAKDEIDDSVARGKIDCGFRVFGGQVTESRSFASRQHHAENFYGGSSPRVTGRSLTGLHPSSAERARQ